MKFSTAVVFLASSSAIVSAWRFESDNQRFNDTRDTRCSTVRRQRDGYYLWVQNHIEPGARRESQDGCCLVLHEGRICDSTTQQRRVCRREFAGTTDFEYKSFEVTGCSSGKSWDDSPSRGGNRDGRDGNRDRDWDRNGNGNNGGPSQSWNQPSNNQPWNRDGGSSQPWSGQPRNECINGRDNYGRLCSVSVCVNGRDRETGRQC